MIQVAQNDKIQLFEDKRIRTAWDEEKEEWYFSIVDVVAVLTEQPDARHASTYWAVLKKRLNKEGAGQLLTNCKQLKMTASDGKKRLTDVADTEQLLRIIQSIPSPKAEPFKLWLAQVGRERIEETIDPELTIDRALETYLRKGYSREWINQRLQAIQVRKELADEWNARGVQKGIEYAILTDEISRAFFHYLEYIFSAKKWGSGKNPFVFEENRRCRRFSNPSEKYFRSFLKIIGAVGENQVGASSQPRLIRSFQACGGLCR